MGMARHLRDCQVVKSGMIEIPAKHGFRVDSQPAEIGNKEDHPYGRSFFCTSSTGQKLQFPATITDSLATPY